MSTRAASVATSQTAKRTLVNLLFQSKYTRKGPDAHRKLDVASYSYVELRDAYLKRIQLIHPDKFEQYKNTKHITNIAMVYRNNTNATNSILISSDAALTM